MPEASVADLFQSAIEHHQAGRLSEAESLCRQILAREPGNADALHFLGFIAFRVGRHELAVQLLERATTLAPRNYRAFSDLGETYRVMGRLDDAARCLSRSTELSPDFPDATYNLGLTLRDQGQIQQALDCFDRAIALNPSCPEFHNTRGVALAELGTFDDAIESYRRALLLRPDFPLALLNLGNVFVEQANFKEAEATYHRALQLHPGFSEAKFNLSFLLLLQGDYERGWPLYEARVEAFAPERPTYPGPAWTGDPVAGKRILLHTEQGFGDSIQFIRYADLLAQKGARVLVQCDHALVPVLRTMPAIDVILPPGDPLPEFDFHLPMLSLPAVFRTTRETIPQNVPYLLAEDDRRATWRARLASAAAPWRVGLVWAGKPAHRRDRQRSISLELLRPLLDVMGVQFISLQLGSAAAQLGASSSHTRVLDVTPHLQDFADTAALMAELDLLISVDTAAIHLAGALGRPTWALLPYVPDWRWGMEGEDTPWYPSMRLFRQPAPGDWPSVIARVREQLQRLIQTARNES